MKKNELGVMGVLSGVNEIPLRETKTKKRTTYY
jgi:hypothetical protein